MKWAYQVDYQQEVTTMIKTLSSSLSLSVTDTNGVFEQVQGLFD